MIINLNDDLFPQEERDRLCALFNIQNQNETEFQSKIQAITRAAIMEYKEMLLANGLPSRADEIRQHRLFYLIKYYFDGRLPTEGEVSSMFQLTQSESRSLIKNVKTRFRYSLTSEINTTLRDIVTAAEATPTNTKYTVIIHSENVLEELNRIIENMAPHCNPISKCRGTSKKYEIESDTYAVLAEHFDLTAEPERTE